MGLTAAEKSPPLDLMRAGREQLPGPRRRETCVVTIAFREAVTTCQRTWTAQADLKGWDIGNKYLDFIFLPPSYPDQT